MQYIISRKQFEEHLKNIFRLILQKAPDIQEQNQPEPKTACSFMRVFTVVLFTQHNKTNCRNHISNTQSTRLHQAGQLFAIVSNIEGQKLSLVVLWST